MLSVSPFTWKSADGDAPLLIIAPPVTVNVNPSNVKFGSLSALFEVPLAVNILLFVVGVIAENPVPLVPLVPEVPLVPDVPFVPEVPAAHLFHLFLKYHSHR